MRRITLWNGNVEEITDEQWENYDLTTVSIEEIEENGILVTKYYQDGKLHREGGPAIQSTKSSYWFRNGQLHNESGAAYIIYDNDGNTEHMSFFYEGQLYHSIKGVLKEKKRQIRKSIEEKAKQQSIESKTQRIVQIKNEIDKLQEEMDQLEIELEQLK